MKLVSCFYREWMVVILDYESIHIAKQSEMSIDIAGKNV